MPSTLTAPPEQFVAVFAGKYLSQERPSAPPVEDPPAKELFKPYLRSPLFALKEVVAVAPHITYRKLNDWDERGLLRADRQTKNTGWRRFSVMEVIILQIIADLKRFGFDDKRIRRVRHAIEHEGIPTSQDPLASEMFEVLLYGTRLMLGVSYTGLPGFYADGPMLSGKFMPPIRKALNRTLPIRPKRKEQIEPYIVLPFHAYIERMRQSQVFLERMRQLEHTVEHRGSKGQ